MGVVRIAIWNLGDAKTTLEELRARLPALAAPSAWVANEAAERFGLVAFGDEPSELAAVAELIGNPPDAYEEFDTV